MIYKIAAKEKPKKNAKLHVALIDTSGTVKIHEELPTARARLRYKMMCLQVELNELKGKTGYSAYMGEDWPIPVPAEGGVKT